MSEKQKLEIPSLFELETKIHESIIGQDAAVREIAKLYSKLRSGIRSAAVGPLDSIFLAGPSGTGKTELVMVLAKMLMETAPEAEGNISIPALGLEAIQKELATLERDVFQGESEARFLKRKRKQELVLIKEAGPKELNRRRSKGLPLVNDEDVLTKIIKIDGGNFQMKHEIATILGSPHGHVGFDEYCGLLHSDELPKHEITFEDSRGNLRKLIIILLDEAEKGHEALHNAFLTILDKGRLTLGDNSISDLQNTVIFFTSNIGNVEMEKDREHGVGFIGATPSVGTTFTRAFKGMFRPEYRGRINKTLVFEYLTREQVRRIVDLQLIRAEQTFDNSGLHLSFRITPAARELVVDRGYNLSEGARAIKKVITGQIIEPLILATSKYDLNWQTVIVDVENDGRVAFFLVKAGDMATAKKARA